MTDGMVQSVFTEIRVEEGERRRHYVGWHPSGRDDPLYMGTEKVSCI
jgi:hypothetical protein